MQNVQSALNEVKELYQQIVGKPAPAIPPSSYVSFPPGVDPVHHAIEEVEQLRRLSRQVAAAPALPVWAPRADTFLSRDGLVIRMEIPGVSREEVKVLVAGGECIVRGERKQATEELRPLGLERPWGPFERRFLLPTGVHPEKVSARFRDGVLELRIAGDGDGIPGEMTVEVE
jgi:HSP20 family protein